MTPFFESDTLTASVPISAATTLGTVRLTVSDLARSRSFYEDVLGLRSRELEDGGLAFGAFGAPGEPGAPGAPALVELQGDSSAPLLDPRRTGLYHLAILLPSRVDLAHALARVAQARWPLDGASDHLVSEALYLSDPDGNGIEIYRDRPREQWRHDGGQPQMATLALDLHSIAAELSSANGPQSTVPAATTIGHVHLQVADIGEAEDFYHGVLGFDVTVRAYPGALFVSAGGYHHHIGLNTWHSARSCAPAPGTVGLRSFEVNLPDHAELGRVLARVRAAGVQTAADPSGATIVRDPSGNGVLLRSS